MNYSPTTGYTTTKEASSLLFKAVKASKVTKPKKNKMYTFDYD